MLAAVYICLCQFVLHLGVFSSLHPLSPFLSGITNLPLHAVNTPLWRSGAHNHLPSVCCFAFLSFLIRPASSLLIFYPCLFCFHTHHRDVTTIAALQCYSHAAGQSLTMLVVWSLGDSVARSGAMRRSWSSTYPLIGALLSVTQQCHKAHEKTKGNKLHKLWTDIDWIHFLSWCGGVITQWPINFITSTCSKQEVLVLPRIPPRVLMSFYTPHISKHTHTHNHPHTPSHKERHSTNNSLFFITSRTKTDLSRAKQVLCFPKRNVQMTHKGIIINAL